MEVLPICVCMIARNEQTHIESALSSVRRYVQQIVVLDSGSEDDTVSIAQRYADSVQFFKWCEDFSGARNACAALSNCAWILALDADETVTDIDVEAVRLFLKNADTIGRVRLVNIGQEDRAVRLGRLYCRDAYAFEGSIHEALMPIAIERKVTDVPIGLLHYGYEQGVVEAQGKAERNRTMLLAGLKKHPDDAYLQYQLGKNYSFNGRDLDKACAAFEKALSLVPDMQLEYVTDLLESYGNALFGAQQYEKSMQLLFITQNHPSARMKFLTAMIYMNNGKFDKALECFERCIEPDSGEMISSCMPRYNIGVILELAGFSDQASQYYRACGDYAPALARLSAMQETDL